MRLEDIISEIQEDINTDEVTRLVSDELNWRLLNSDTSMLASGMVSDHIMVRTNVGAAQGYILAVDFGGSTLKWALVQVPGFKILAKRSQDISQKIVDLEFFDVQLKTVCEWVQICIEENLIDASIYHNLRVGVTFSFPLNARGEITTMGKGFVMTDSVRNIKLQTLLRASFKRVLSNMLYKNCPFNVEVKGVINDSIAVFLTNKVLYRHHDTVMILGTGLNFCFSLPAARVPIEKLPIDSERDSTGQVLINSEAGFLGKGYMNLSSVDAGSNANNGLFMPLEFLTGGKWIAETLKTALFKSQIISPRDLESTKINGELICAILNNQNNILPFVSNKKTYHLIRELLKAIVRRAALYLTAVIRGIYLFQYGNDDVSPSIHIGFSGSFLRHCKFYYESLNQLSNKTIEYTYLPNSNILGAAIYAAYAP